MPRARIALRRITLFIDMPPDLPGRMWRGWVPPEKTLRMGRGRSRGPFASADSIVRPTHLEVEPGDDSGVAAGRKLGNPRGHPGVVVLRVGDDVGIAPGAHREDPRRLGVRVAEGVPARSPPEASLAVRTATTPPDPRRDPKPTVPRFALGGHCHAKEVPPPMRRRSTP